MIEYFQVFMQASLDAVTMYVICSLVAVGGIHWNKQSLLWLFWFLLFCCISQFTFIVSEPATIVEVAFENYDLLPVNSWEMLVLLFLTVLILNSSLFKTGSIEAIFMTVLSFVIWIIVRLMSVVMVGLFLPHSLLDRIISLLIVSVLIISPINKLLKAFRGRNFYTKFMMFNSFVVLIFILAFTNFKQALVLENVSFVFVALLLIISLNLWILNEQRKNLVQENRLTVIEHYLPVIDDLVTEMRAKQHEFNNKLLAIAGIVETENDVKFIREKVREYTEYALPKLAIQQLLSVDHKVMAGFLYSKMKLAEWKRIKIVTEIKTDFRGFQSNEYDWIETLGILLDNAIEATLPLEEIKVTLKQSGEMLELSVSNPGDYITNREFMKMFERGYSTKANKRRHRGYGLYALKQLTEQHSGKIITKNEEMHGHNYVTIGVLLP